MKFLYTAVLALAISFACKIKADPGENDSTRSLNQTWEYAEYFISGGGLEMAKELSLAALKEAENQEDHARAGKILEALSSLYLREKSFSEAREFARDALHKFEALGDQEETGRLYFRLAEIYFQQDSLQEAAQFASLGANTLEGAGNQWDHLEAKGMNALSVFLKEGDFSRAEAWLQTYDSLKTPPSHLTEWYLKIRFEEAARQGMWEKAMKYRTRLDSLFLAEDDFSENDFLKKDIYTKLITTHNQNSLNQEPEKSSNSIQTTLLILFGILSLLLFALSIFQISSNKKLKKELEEAREKRQVLRGKYKDQKKESLLLTQQLKIQGEEKEALSKNIKDWESKADRFESRVKDLQAELNEHRTKLSGIELESRVIALNSTLGHISAIYDEIDADGKKPLSERLKTLREGLGLSELLKDLKAQFEIAHPDFLEKLSGLHPTLTDHDIEICMMVRAGLHSREIAVLLQITPHAVDVARYRIRKKMELPKGTNFTKYLEGI